MPLPRAGVERLNVLVPATARRLKLPITAPVLLSNCSCTFSVAVCCNVSTTSVALPANIFIIPAAALLLRTRHDRGGFSFAVFVNNYTPGKNLLLFSGCASVYWYWVGALAVISRYAGDGGEASAVSTAFYFIIINFFFFGGCPADDIAAVFGAGIKLQEGGRQDGVEDILCQYALEHHIVAQGIHVDIIS